MRQLDATLECSGSTELLDGGWAGLECGGWTPLLNGFARVFESAVKPAHSENSSRAWMKLLMDGLEPLGVDMGVNLGGGDVGVAEHFLNNTQRCAVLQQVAGEGVAQRVRRHIFHDAGPFGVLLDNLPQSLPAQCGFPSGDKHILQKASPVKSPQSEGCGPMTSPPL